MGYEIRANCSRRITKYNKNWWRYGRCGVRKFDALEKLLRRMHAHSHATHEYYTLISIIIIYQREKNTTTVTHGNCECNRMMNMWTKIAWQIIIWINVHDNGTYSENCWNVICWQWCELKRNDFECTIDFFFLNQNWQESHIATIVTRLRLKHVQRCSRHAIKIQIHIHTTIQCKINHICSSNTYSV